MKYFLFIPLLFLMACESTTLNTGQDLTVKLVGTDSAFCWLSTSNNRYELYAPGTVFIERTGEELKIDCDDNNSDRRRVVKLESEWDLTYYRFPETVTVNFAKLDNGSRYNGYRVQMEHDDSSTLTPVSLTGEPSAELNVDNSVATEILTEDSYSAPLSTDQSYPVQKDYTMGRRSTPVSTTY